MLALLNSLNSHNLPIFQPILMILVSKFMVHRVLSGKTYLSLGLLSPFKLIEIKIDLIFLKITMISLTTNTTSIQAVCLAFNIAC